MVLHEAVSVADPVEAPDAVGKNGQKSLTVVIIGKDILPGIAPVREVVDGAGKF